MDYNKEKSLIGTDVADGIETTVYSHIENDRLIIDKIVKLKITEKKKKTLSDKATGLGATEKEYLYVKDVKQFIKDLYDYINNAPKGNISIGLLIDISNKIKELAGVKLI